MCNKFVEPHRTTSLFSSGTVLKSGEFSKYIPSFKSPENNSFLTVLLFQDYWKRRTNTHSTPCSTHLMPSSDGPMWSLADMRQHRLSGTVLFSIWLVWNIGSPLRHMLSKWMHWHKRTVTRRLGAMLQELPVQKWMLQRHVL